MKLGMFMMPLHPPEKPRTQCYDEDVEQIVLADELGFSEVWIGEHLSLDWENIPSNEIFIANLIARTRQIRLGTGVTIIPQHHPVNTASRLALLDHLSHGRLNIGLGQGAIPTDQALFGLPDSATQGLMTIEGIDLVLKLWQTEPPFDFEGKYWRVTLDKPVSPHGIGVLTKPYQRPHPPIAMGLNTGRMSAPMCGQRGWIPISGNLVAISTVARHWTWYREGAREAGRPAPDRSIWRVARNIFVGETNDDAWEFARRGSLGRSFEDYMLHLLASARILGMVKSDPQMPDEEVTTDYVLKNLCIIGDPESCIRQLENVWEQTGGFGTLVMIAHDWDDRARWKRSMELLATKVVPALPTI